MKILVLVSDRILPPVTGTRVRNFYLWSALKDLGVEVKILGINLDRNEKNPRGPDGINCEFFSHKKKSATYRYWNALTKSFQQWPRSSELVNRVRELDNEWQPDIIHAEEMRMAYYLPCYQNYKSNSKQSVTFHNVESELLKMTGSSPINFGRSIIEYLHRSSLRSYEKKCAEIVDLSFAYSEIDFMKYKKLYPNAHWAVTQNGTNASMLSVEDQKKDNNLLIVGSLSYYPNITGLYWFLDKILPHLGEAYSVTIAGSRATTEVRERLNQENVDFVDTPESLDPYFKKCSLCIVPVFEGSGTRGKILESLAQERVVITTKLGVEGLDLNENTGVVISDESNFLNNIMKWCQLIEKRKESASKGRQFVLENYDWGVVASNLKTSWSAL